MPRNMSFAMTTEQVKNRTKNVTRRFGWWFLKEGDVLWAVEKSMGLPKGGRVNRLAKIQVVSVLKEPLNEITQQDVIKEGFPSWTPKDFVEFLVSHYKCDPTKDVNRIEFRYLP